MKAIYDNGVCVKVVPDDIPIPMRPGREVVTLIPPGVRALKPPKEVPVVTKGEMQGGYMLSAGKRKPKERPA